jgi:hypothetical protein
MLLCKMEWLPPIYIMCHPEHEPIRYQLLLKHLPARGIPMEKVRWVRGPWGSDIDSDLYFKVCDPFTTRFGNKLSLSFKSAALLKGEVSLNLSFYTAVSMSLHDGAEKAIFFESDVVLREDFLGRLAEVLKAAEAEPWDYISLGEGCGTRPPAHADSYFAATTLYTPPHHFVFRCTDSMIISRSFLEKLSHTLIPFRECLDWEMNLQMMAHRGKSLWADPPLVEPGSGRGRTLSSLPS